MMIQRGFATFGLDYGKCPKWLFERMVKLSRGMIRLIVEEEGSEGFLKRIADPVWFQSLGTVLAFDWNSSGLTTILTAVLKEAIRGQEKELGIFICGGKGKTSRKTPQEIEIWGEKLSLPELKVKNLIYNSKMAAKVDNTLIQDGFQIYHHSFFFTKNGSWAVVQQGMNPYYQKARRYHWFSQNIKDLICEPHSGITQPLKRPVLNLTARQSEEVRNLSVDLVNNGYQSLMKEIKILRKYFSKLSQTLALKFKEETLTFLNLENLDFTWHPVLKEDFTQNKYLEKILWKVCELKPENYEKLLSIEGVGPKTIRALALISEVIYGAKPSYQDPARYSFAYGGKDKVPYPVDRKTYDETISLIKKYLDRVKKTSRLL